MANVNAKLKVSELDFDKIKSNLKTFLKNQSEFSDFNFEGAGISVILDLLAYNTHYMGYYMNMVANEMFIDSAVTRSSVVSHAKLLGYMPTSRVASQAVLKISIKEVTGGSNGAMTIPRFTKFTSSAKDGKNYIFVNTEQYVASRNSTGYFNFTDVQIKEGIPSTYTFTYDEPTNSKQAFVIPTLGIDTSTIQVQIQTSITNATIENFEKASNFTSVSGDDPVYFIEENIDGKYQIYFGDGIIGKRLDDGNIVIVTFITTSGTDANGIRSFKMAESIKPGSQITIATTVPSSSGKLEESIDSIKFSSSKSFVAQNRAVTKNDYIAMISKNYPYFDSVTVWGGEENDPPQYGKIYFSAKPRGNYQITETEIEYVKTNVIAPMSMLTVTPEYIEPDYNFLNFKVDVTYDPRLTSSTPGQIKTKVYNAIVNYNNSNFNTFNSSFKISKLIRAIDDADPSIQNNIVQVNIEKRFRPLLNQTATYTINFNVPLLRGTSINRLISEPSFKLVDSLSVTRKCFLEEIPQSFSGVEDISITDPGGGYTDIPTITVSGDGEGATATAIIVNGSVKSIKVTNSGSGYTTASVKITGGNGSGATAKALMEGKIGKIRAYYYNSNSIKTIINEEAGIIYYDSGIVQLIDFAPTAVNDAFGTMALKSTPAFNAFSTKRNAILALDSTDPGSIDISVGIVE